METVTQWKKYDSCDYRKISTDNDVGTFCPQSHISGFYPRDILSIGGGAGEGGGAEGAVAPTCRQWGKRYQMPPPFFRLSGMMSARTKNIGIYR